MNVLVTLNALTLGGSQINALDLAVTAQQRGVRPVIVGYRSTMPDTGPSMLDVADDRGVRLEVLDVATDTSSAAPALSRLADAHDIDIVHGYGGWDLRAAFQGPCRWGRRPLVQTVYEMYLPDQTYPHQPLVVGTRYLLEEQTPIRPGTVDLISPPVDLRADRPEFDGGEFATRFGLDRGRCSVVIVSRLDSSMKELGIRHTIEAMEILDRPEVDLFIVGGGDAEERLWSAGERVNERLGRTAVTFCGPMHDPRGAYSSADIVIGMGSSAARALAFAKPVIVCGEEGWYRTFTPETSALLFRNSFWSDEREADPVSRLAEQIRRLADDPAQQQELSRYGRRFAEQNFGLELMAERLVGVYERALKGHRRRNWFRDLPVEVRPGLSWVRRRLTGRR